MQSNDRTILALGGFILFVVLLTFPVRARHTREVLAPAPAESLWSWASTGDIDPMHLMTLIPVVLMVLLGAYIYIDTQRS